MYIYIYKLYKINYNLLYQIFAILEQHDDAVVVNLLPRYWVQILTMMAAVVVVVVVVQVLH